MGWICYVSLRYDKIHLFFCIFWDFKEVKVYFYVLYRYNSLFLSTTQGPLKTVTRILYFEKGFETQKPFTKPVLRRDRSENFIGQSTIVYVWVKFRYIQWISIKKVNEIIVFIRKENLKIWLVKLMFIDQWFIEVRNINYINDNRCVLEFDEVNEITWFQKSGV